MDCLISGGLPTTKLMKDDKGRLNVIGAVAKFAAAHKGILLEHEMQHIKALGINMGEELSEILFVAGQIQGLNHVMPHYVNQGAPIEDFLKKVGPFKETVYKDLMDAEEQPTQ